MRITKMLALCALICSGAGAALACTLPDIRTDVAPQPGPGQPVEVTAAIIVSDIMGIDDLNQQISLDLAATLTWRDPRLEGLEGRCQVRPGSLDPR